MAARHLDAAGVEEEVREALHELREEGRGWLGWRKEEAVVLRGSASAKAARHRIGARQGLAMATRRSGVARRCVEAATDEHGVNVVGCMCGCPDMGVRPDVWTLAIPILTALQTYIYHYQ